MKKEIILLLFSLILSPVFAQKKAAHPELALNVHIATYDVRLNWIPDPRWPDARYEIERSEDGRTYLLLDCIAASQVGKAGSCIYTDANARFLIGPLIYYRIRRVDADGVSVAGPVAVARIDPHVTGD